MNAADTIKKLESTLPREKYGKGKTKTWENLCEEIRLGESEVIWEENIPIRVIRLASVEVISPTEELHLFEEKQVFTDGRTREREICGVSEKCVGEENAEKAAIRGVDEELGIKRIPKMEFVGAKTDEMESPSYPGLKTRYLKFEFRCVLYASEFKEEGYVEVQSDKQTHFVWKPISTEETQ